MLVSEQGQLVFKDSSFSSYRVTFTVYPMLFDNRLENFYVLNQYGTCDSFKIFGESKEVMGLI